MEERSGSHVYIWYTIDYICTIFYHVRSSEKNAVSFNDSLYQSIFKYYISFVVGFSVLHYLHAVTFLTISCEEGPSYDWSCVRDPCGTVLGCMKRFFLFFTI